MLHALRIRKVMSLSGTVESSVSCRNAYVEINFAAKISSLDGHSRWFPMTITQVDTYTNMNGVTSIWQMIIQLPLHGTLLLSHHPTLIAHKNRTCKIGNNTMIGPSTQINENAEIVASVIGCNCSIGTGTIIRNSYIFDGTTIGSDCVIERSIIGAGVSIRDNSVVQRGSLVGDGVIVGPSALLRPFERLSRKRDSTDSSEDEDSDIEDVEACKLSIFCPIIRGNGLLH